VIPQTDATAAPTGSNAIWLSDQNNLGNCCSYDGGYTGQFAVSATNAGTFSGEGDFSGQGKNNATPIVGPLTGTFSADGANLGRFTGSITTTPAFPLGPVNGTTPGTENVSYYMANSSQGFVIETDTIAPVFGVIEAQAAQSAAKKHQFVVKPRRNSSASGAVVSGTTKHPEILRRSR